MNDPESSPAASPSADSNLRVAVIGGGISGLAAAHRLHELDPSVEIAIFEADDGLGGVLRTEAAGGYLLEHGADMFTTRDPWALALCQRLGLSDELLETNQAERRAFVVHRGRLVPVPPGFTLMSPARIWPVLTTPLLSWRGKLRLASEWSIPTRRSDADESLADFARRRMGSEAYERLIQPLIGGIYTADPEQLSMRAALPQFVEMEKSCGSLIRGARRAAAQRGGNHESGARYGMFLAPRLGMQQIVDRLKQRLANAEICLRSPIRQVSRGDAGGYRLEIEGRHLARTFDRLVIATPARVAARLLAGTNPGLSSLLQVPCASVAIVLLGVRRDQITHRLNGFGFVVPMGEKRRLLSTSFSSVKFPGRAPEGRVLLRVFIGGACQAELAELDDAGLLDLVAAELRDLIGLEGPPELVRIVRWKNAMPQYHVEHLARVQEIERAVAGMAGLELAGNSYRGVGVPFCIHSGELAAERILGVRRPTAVEFADQTSTT